MRTIEVMVSGFIPWYERLEEFCVDVDVPAYLAYANSFSKISYISLYARSADNGWWYTVGWP